jgi:hypothetical protein
LSKGRTGAEKDFQKICCALGTNGYPVRPVPKTGLPEGRWKRKFHKIRVDRKPSGIIVDISADDGGDSQKSEVFLEFFWDFKLAQFCPG